MDEKELPPLPDSLADSTLAFEGVRFNVRSIQRKGSDGKSYRKDAVLHPGAVVILPMLSRKELVLIRNERFCVGEVLWELPAGTLELAEEPIHCAERELREETGYRCAKISPMSRFYATPGICSEQLHAFLAEDLSFVGQDLDATEEIAVETLALEKALEMIKDNRICDAKTMLTILHYVQFYL